MIVFGIRGLRPCNSKLKWLKEHRLVSAKINFLHPRCTIGIWNRENEELIVYEGSTVPSKEYVFKFPGCIQNVNILHAGMYQLSKGIHPRSITGFQPHDAFLMDGYAISFLPEIRFAARGCDINTTKGKYAVILAGDNLHASRYEPVGFSERSSPRFSSSGCITVSGQPTEYVTNFHPGYEWNHWAHFYSAVSSMSLSEESIKFILFFSEDINCANKASAIRYGSEGRAVLQVQQVLSGIYNAVNSAPYYNGDLSWKYDENTAVAILSFKSCYRRNYTGPDVILSNFFSSIQHFTKSKIRIPCCN